MDWNKYLVLLLKKHIKIIELVYLKEPSEFDFEGSFKYVNDREGIENERQYEILKKTENEMWHISRVLFW